MTRFVWTETGWSDVTGWKRPAPVFPSIIRDYQPPLIHPATGQFFDSKSAFRAATKAAGCVELGTDAPVAPQRPAYNPAGIKDDIAQSIEMLEQGWQPPPFADALDVETRTYT